MTRTRALQWIGLAVLAAAAAFAWHAATPTIAGPAPVPVAARGEGEPAPASELVGTLPRRAPAPTAASTRPASTYRELPVWPGDEEERLPEPPGDGPLVVTVIDHGGRRLSGAHVRLAPAVSPPVAPARERPQPASAPPDPDCLGITDAHGRCRVRATAGDTLLATVEGRAAGLAGVDAAALARRQLDLVVRDGVAVLGTVLGTDRRGVAGAVVQARALGCGRGRTFAGTTDGQGRFVWLLDGGCDYDLTARAGEVLSEVVRVEQAVGGSLQVGVRLLGAAVIEGRVLDPHGVAIAGASVQVVDLGGHRFVRAAEAAFTVPSAEDGGFRVPLPDAGRYRVEASHPDWAPAPAADVGVDLGLPTPVTLRLGLWAEFAGMVRWRDGPPIAGARLRFVARDGVAPAGQSGAFDATFEASTGADGSYRAANVPSHLRYEVVCLPDPLRPELRLERTGLPPSPQHFVFDPALAGAGVDLAVDVAEGEAPAAVVVRLCRRTDRGGWLRGVDETVPVAAGRARVTRLRPGVTYFADVRAPGFGPARSAEFEAGRDAEAGVRLPRGARLEVRVVDAQGGAAVAAEVWVQQDLLHGDSWLGTADRHGRAAFADLPPGRVTVRASRGPFQHSSRRVEFAAGGRQRVEITIE